MIYSVSAESDEGKTVLIMELRCASNETLNPGKLLESLFKFSGLDITTEQCRITRKELYATGSSGKKVPVYEAQQQ